MPDIRDTRRKARRALHDKLRVPAYYRATQSAPWTLVYVRDFTKMQAAIAFGRHDVQLGLASIQDADRRILIMRDEFAEKGLRLVRAGEFSLAADEAFSVDNIDPPDDITVTAHVTQIRDTTGFPVPE